VGIRDEFRAFFAKRFRNRGRQAREPQRDTRVYPQLFQVGGGHRLGPRQSLPKPTPRNLRYFGRTPIARRAINAIKNPIVELEWEIVPKPSVKLNAEIKRQIEIATACFMRPNNDDSFRTLLEQTIEDIICGAGAIEIQPSGDVHRPLWMWPTDGLAIQIYPAWSGALDEARYCQVTGFGTPTGGGAQIDLRNDELIYLRPNPSTSTPFGVGALEVAFQTISRLLATAEFVGNLASNQRPSILMDLGDVSGEDVAAFRVYWQNEVEGQGKVPIVGFPGAPGDPKTRGVGINRLFPEGDDALYLKYQEFLIRTIACSFDLSPQNLSVEADVNRNCYSDDTETLTIDGWKTLDELSEESVVATYNPETMSVEFRKPESMHVASYDGDMIHISGRMTDTLVTPDHRMWVRRLGHGDGSKTPGGEYKIIPASDIGPANAQFATVASFAPERHDRVETFTLPGCKCGGGVRREYPPRDIPMDDWLAFLGYFISEGYAGRVGAGSWKINLSQNIGKPVCEEMGRLLSRLPFAFEKCDSDGVTRRWQVADKALCMWLLDNCGDYSNTRRIPDFVFKLPVEQMKIVFEALMKGDGTMHNDKAHRKSGAYYTNSSELRDQVQLLAAYLGHRAVAKMHLTKPVAGVYRVKITLDTRENCIRGDRNVARVPYSGRVYCFSVPPHHLFVTRRNGKISVHGNTSETAGDRDWEHAIRPMAALLGAHFNREAIEGLLGFSQIMFRFRGIDREDEDATSRIMETYYKANVLTPNQILEHIGKQPNKSAWGDKHYADVEIAKVAARGVARLEDPDLHGEDPAKSKQKLNKKDMPNGEK
jgi:hypothetical protein